MIYANKAVQVWLDTNTPQPVNMYRLRDGWVYIYKCKECGREYVAPFALYNEPAVCVDCRKEG